jgi:hypothetical protein
LNLFSNGRPDARLSGKFDVRLRKCGLERFDQLSSFIERNSCFKHLFLASKRILIGECSLFKSSFLRCSAQCSDIEAGVVGQRHHIAAFEIDAVNVASFVRHGRHTNQHDDP